MKTVYKYKIPTEDRFELELPRVRQILSFQWQEGTGLCLWALVDLETMPRTSRFLLLTTGGETKDLDQPFTFIGTAQIPNGSGSLVFHLFEVF